MTRRSERWSLDFVHDALESGRRIRTLNIIKDFSRECLAIEVDTSLSGVRVARVLDQNEFTRGYPSTIAMACWASDRRVRLHFIQFNDCLRIAPTSRKSHDIQVSPTLLSAIAYAPNNPGLEARRNVVQRAAFPRDRPVRCIGLPAHTSGCDSWRCSRNRFAS